MRDDITVLVVNWNQRQVTELMLRSYAKHHEGINNLLLVDNYSTDDSREFFSKNGIPYIGLHDNIGHEQAINFVWPLIKTKYVLISDSDVQYIGNVHTYLDHLDAKTIAAGDLITGDKLNDPIVPRIAAWFFMLDVEAVRAHGIHNFRDNTGWNYDVGSHMTERIFNLGFKHYQITRLPADQDRDIVGWQYPTHWHYGRLSWNLKNHADREGEVSMRMNHIRQQLTYYQDIELQHRFRLL